MTVEAGSSHEDLETTWQRQMVFWHLVFAAVWLGAVIVTLLDDSGPRGRGLELACIVGVGVAYAALGARGLAREDEWQGAAYLLIAWGLVIT
ncbi:hypothetical protein, partial [Nostocoides australiense]|nr:hypothetical protein [Tetrasphaera australiensis]